MMKNKMSDEVFLSDYTYKFCYNYINELYLEEVKKNNNSELEEFEISIFIEEKYDLHKPIFKEKIYNEIKTMYPDLLDLFNKISVDFFEDDEYNKGIFYEKICQNKIYNK